MSLLALLLGLALAAPPLDLNTATEADLITLAAIGPQRAARLVAWREAHGPFDSLDALTAVPGFSAVTVANLQGRAVASPVAAAPHGEPVRLDVNAASAAELAGLPGVSAALAEAIVADREVHGRFDTCAELERVPSLGPATAAALRDQCTAE